MGIVALWLISQAVYFFFLPFTCGVCLFLFAGRRFTDFAVFASSWLAIRKGLPTAQEVEEKYKISVPSDMIDDYSYLCSVLTCGISERTTGTIAST